MGMKLNWGPGGVDGFTKNIKKEAVKLGLAHMRKEAEGVTCPVHGQRPKLIRQLGESMEYSFCCEQLKKKVEGPFK
jgi:hypothetical protein